jgi:hypothetical protein
MPNDCSNHITITFPSDVKQAIEADIKQIYGEIKQSGPYGIRFHYTSAWVPDYDWLNDMTTKYPHCWIKNEWISEDGTAGVWIWRKNQVKHLEWDDLSMEDEHYMFQ